MKYSAKIAMIHFLFALLPLEGEEPSSVPFRKFCEIFMFVDGRKIDGIEYIPVFLKLNEQDKVYNPAVAKLRLRTKQGKVQLLRVEDVKDMKIEELSKADINLINEGYTHRVWVPKLNEPEMDGAELLHSLPEGSIKFSQHRMLFER